MTEVRGPWQELSEAEPSVAALVALEQRAWSELFQRYYRKMYNFAYVRTSDVNAAEEIASEVFAAAAHAISRYRDTGAPIGAWLYRIARNITADHVDKRRRRPAISIDAVALEVGSGAVAIEDAADLSRCIALLTREQQEVIALRFFADCSLQEAAVAMGKSVSAIKLLQHRAMVALRRQLKPGAAP